MFLLLSSSSSLILSIVVSISLFVFNLNLSPQSSLPSVVIQSPWQPWATEQWEPTVGRLSFARPLFAFSLRLSLQFQYGVALFLASLLKCRDDSFTLFLHTSLPHVVVYTHPSFSHSFVSPVCPDVCLSVCQETVLQQGGVKLAVLHLMWSA